MKSILFNTDMVQAILRGEKTCTRRIIKPQPKGYLAYISGGHRAGDWTYPGRAAVEQSGWDEKYLPTDGMTEDDYKRSWTPPCHTDDALYVRETWCRYEPQDIIDGVKYAYRADANADTEKIRIEMGYKWRPSVHMPKDAARIFLKVTCVEVQRLQDINAAGCRAEGLWDDYKTYSKKYHENLAARAYPKAFAELWNSTIKTADRDRYGWDANPWVWVIHFRRIERSGSNGTENKD